MSTREIDIVDVQHDPPQIATPAGLAGFTLCAPPEQTPEFDLVRYCAPAALAVPYATVVGLKLAALNPSVLGGG